MFACLFLPSSAAAKSSAVEPDALEAVARAFSPRVEVHSADVVTLDVAGLRRLLGTDAEIGCELQREAHDRGCRVNVAMAASRTAAMLLAFSRPGVTVVPRGEERQALARLPLRVLSQLSAAGSGQPIPVLDLFRRWGLKTLGELALLPAPALSERIGQDGLRWQRLARGEDLDPLVPMAPEPPIEERLDLDWPVEGLEPLSFLLPRLLEPIADRLERLDEAAVTLEVVFRLATREEVTRRLQLPAPMRDPKVLRTLLLLHLESHPLDAGVDRLTVRVEPAPARVVQFSLLARALPVPEQVATLLARLSALMGERRVGAGALVDTHRPGASAMQRFTVAEPQRRVAAPPTLAPRPQPRAPRVVLRRFRLPVPARVIVQDGRPVRVTTERRGLEGGRVEASAGPWRTSGDWWHVPEPPAAGDSLPAASRQLPAPWNRDEWDVALGDGGVYRIYRDRATERWFMDAILD